MSLQSLLTLCPLHLLLLFGLRPLRHELILPYQRRHGQSLLSLLSLLAVHLSRLERRAGVTRLIRIELPHGELLLQGLVQLGICHGLRKVGLHARLSEVLRLLKALDDVLRLLVDLFLLHGRELRLGHGRALHLLWHCGTHRVLQVVLDYLRGMLSLETADLFLTLWGTQEDLDLSLLSIWFFEMRTGD